MSWLVQGKRHGWGLVTYPCIVGNLDKILAGKKNKSFWRKTTSFFVLCSSFFFHCWESCLSNNSLIKCYVIHSYCQFFMILRRKELLRNYLLKHHLPIWWGSNTLLGCQVETCQLHWLSWQHANNSLLCWAAPGCEPGKN